MENQLYYNIQGYLQAFEQLNTFTNHGSYYSFNYISYDTDIVLSIKRHLREENVKLMEQMPGSINDFNEDIVLEFKQENNWEALLINDLEQFFLEVFYEEYIEKHKSAHEKRKSCVSNFIKLLKEFFADNLENVWCSGADSYYSTLTQYYHECSGIDYIFKAKDGIYLLHLGICD
ncbi:hypothetical protein [Pseudobacteroides cellulosolvens]|uniref:Uncharacterized protein n=1 Tax=Pseudobacteroides cellulosolvens ATCC 35603 = DSM 2933 TaxID=398512 RepID=A0A0L6JMC0_9FIRM|nr:hypothetical protein [Pseudobacteroides cellulosolvens]KNY26919.1 hypothetical protein Bccel_2184 [Pseudobacteroides cellulosolvens ATCC 35603 = DSM 2933]